MKLFVVPGYRDLFGGNNSSYEEVLSNISSEIVIRLIISLNNDLNTNESHSEKQIRLRNLLSFRFSKEQLSTLNNAFLKYRQKAPYYDGTVFARRYLLSMLLKELKRNHKCDADVDDPMHEYNFLLGYLMCVDEINNEGHRLVEKLKNGEKDELSQLKMMWAGFLNQYEFNQAVNGGFEIFRLLCFSQCLYRDLKPFLKALVNKNGFRNLSEFLASFYQLANSTLTIKETEPLKKLNFIKPVEGVNSTHLKNQSINSLLGKHEFSIADIKRYPLYETDVRGYMIIDEDMYRRKVYKGPLFETYYETALNEKMSFTDYKTYISKEAFERICFRSILDSLIGPRRGVIVFDNDAQGIPDLYFRDNKTIFLIEFKDYLFPDSIVVESDFDKMKKYIDERFIFSNKGQKKGVNQLVNYIINIFESKYDFDSYLLDMIRQNKKIEIYPIICYSDFMFSAPGINEYLNSVFYEKLKENNLTGKYNINVTLISLELLFDFAIRGGDFVRLKELIKRYERILYNRKIKFEKYGGMDNFLKSKVSFDELYETMFKSEIFTPNDAKQNKVIKRMYDIVGTSQDILDEVL